MLPFADVSTIIATAPIAFGFGLVAGLVISSKYAVVRKPEQRQESPPPAD